MASFAMSTFAPSSAWLLFALTALIPTATAHMSLFHPSMYGFDRGDPQTVYPLANKGYDQWWFRGNLDNPPRETMMLTPGSTQTVEITCGKWLSSWGSNPSWESCPNDQGSYHAGGQGSGGWGGNQESNLMGCALAIAYKSDAWSVKPEDFIVMSVQEQCVRQRDTPFEIPANLPACPEGGCTCAWFWQGQNSAEEMYMTGFKCDVKGGAHSEIPRPRRPQQSGNSDTATQPFYWANWGAQNVDWQVGWNNRPRYNRKLGWENGAQTKAFAAVAAPRPSSTVAPSPSSSAAPSPSSSPAASSTTTTTSTAPSFTGGNDQKSTAPQPSQTGTHSLDLPNHAADPHPTTTSSTSPAQPSAPSGGKTCRKVRRHPRSRVRSFALH